MNTKIAFLLAAMIALETIVIVKSVEDCNREVIWKAYCGAGCRGTPRCGGNKRCGNVDDVCYCDCSSGFGKFTCRPTRLGLLWNNGAKNPDGT